MTDVKLQYIEAKTETADAWEKFAESGNKNFHFVIGNYYVAKLTNLDIKDTTNGQGGCNATWLSARFDVAGIPVYYSASMPSHYIRFDECKKLLVFLKALGWQNPNPMEDLVGRTCLVRIGKGKKSGKEVIDDLQIQPRLNG
jgi:hypothetical protein